MSDIRFTDPDAVPDYASLLRLDGRLFIVAGAGQGIGRQTAHALAAVGARVICVDIDAELGASVAKEVGGIAYSADITQREQVEALLAYAESEGKLAGIVDIVGIAPFDDLVDISDDHWERAMTINAKHMLLLTSLGGKSLAENGGGVITLIGSVSGMFAAERHAVYGMAKAGVIALTKSAASELGKYRVRVNSVSPGYVWTKRIAALIRDDRRGEYDALSPLGSVASPADVASAVLFLSSDLAGDITGHNLVVDGGSSIKSPLNTSLI